MTLGERIAKRLDELHITQRELAMMVGVTDISMSRYVRGERTPNAPIIANIAKALRVTTDWLLGLEEGDRQDEKD